MAPGWALMARNTCRNIGWRACAVSATCGPFRFGLWLVFGFGLARAKPDAESAVSQVLGILAFVVGAFVTLAAAIYERGERQEVKVYIYVISNLIALAPLTSILRTSNLGFWRTVLGMLCKKEKSLRHHYNPPTINIARWTLATSLVVIFLTARPALRGDFIGQKLPTRIQLPVGQAVVWKVARFPDRPAVVAWAQVNKPTFPNGIPRSLYLQVALLPEFAKEWQLTGSYGVDVPTADEKRPRPVTFVTNPENTSLQGLELDRLEPDIDYGVAITIVAVCTDAVADKAIATINEGHGITISASTSPN